MPSSGVKHHRADVPVEVEGQTYTLCYDLNACALVMDRLGVKSFKQLSDGVEFADLGLRDFIYILWAGLQRHHPDLTERDVGAMDWDLESAAESVVTAFEKALVRKTPPSEGREAGAAKPDDPLKSGTGNEPN